LITRDALMDDLRETQLRAAIHFDGEEKNIGTRCIAAPVLMSGDAVAGLSISGPCGADHRCWDCADRDIGTGRGRRIDPGWAACHHSRIAVACLKAGVTIFVQR
jgi:hypothetical protein